MCIRDRPEFTSLFREELGTRELRVSMTADPTVFEAVAATGTRLLWLHSFGERFAGPDRPANRVPRGETRGTVPVSNRPEGYPETIAYDAAGQRMIVGTGVFEPVRPAVWAFEVSGLKVVEAWLAYRSRAGAGRRRSNLDRIRPRSWTAAFTRELLELLWVIEATLAGYAEQSRLLDAVLNGPLIDAVDLPEVPAQVRGPVAVVPLLEGEE